MLSGFCTDDICFVIKSEDDLINAFEYLMKKDLNPFEAYNILLEKYGESTISKILDNENNDLLC